MHYNLSNEVDVRSFNMKVDYLLLKGKRVNITEVKDTRTSLQNASLHLFFTMITDQLNELGMEYRYFGVTGKELSMMYTDNIVKEFFWKPIQLALFDIESTTKLTTEQMNQVIDVITKFFGDKGVLIEFPNRENLK